jgi:hypothetical protein
MELFQMSTPSYTITTKLGPLELSLPSGPDYIYANFSQGLTVHGITDHGSMKLVRSGASFYPTDDAGLANTKDNPYIRRYVALYVSDRWDGKKLKPCTGPRREKIAGAILEAVNKWAAATSEAFEAATQAQHSQLIAEALNRLDKARGEFDAAYAAWNNAAKDYDRLVGSSAVNGGRQDTCLCSYRRGLE